MIIEFTKSFDSQFKNFDEELRLKTRQTIERFIDCYQSRQFPKGLRVHKCGPFLSLSITMKHRIFVRPISGGIKFVFVGDHAEAERYLKKD